MTELFGYLGAGLLALCAAPLLAETVAAGHAHGVSLTFLVSWWLGEVLMFIHVAGSKSRTAPLLANYILNVGIVGVILFYRVAR